MSDEAMDILVDFDNIDSRTKRAGLYPLCTHLIEVLAGKNLQMPARCRIRLYGGWYERENLTRGAQELSSEIQENFPTAIQWTVNRNSGTCLTQLEMAYSLEADPQRHLFYTHRVRDFSDPVQCDSRVLANCGKADCPLKVVSEFFKLKRCPRQGCYTTPADLMSRREQKLVDTMLTADLIHLAKGGQRELAVVSSDDDLWPGIQTALLAGARVIHVHTRTDRQTPVTYSSGLLHYKQATL
jgi:uncharacterized LabA/DUF88 family protein